MSELPFLKKKNTFNSGGGETVMRESDDGQDGLLDSVAQELFEAIEKKDIKGFRSALEALVLHINDEDKKQDQEDME